MWNSSFKWSTKHWFWSSDWRNIKDEKLEVKKTSTRRRRISLKSSQVSNFFFDLQLWPLIPLQPYDQNQCLVLHLKDPFHICLETKVQGFWMTFKVCNYCSKQPYFNRTYIVYDRVFLEVSVHTWFYLRSSLHDNCYYGGTGCI